MISVEVFSEEKAWSKKLRKKELFLKKFVIFFLENTDFLTRKLPFLYFFLIINVSKS